MSTTASDRKCKELAHRSLEELGFTCKTETRSQLEEGSGSIHCVVELKTASDESLFTIHTELVGERETIETIKTLISEEAKKRGLDFVA